ncbi:M56 family metallopeptidase, partial [Sphingomonas bacterium]|uniref:M56 family metallopeptidase n=1 Tax=Sphingomonas bacterium TaxID=1895847 RepID=UPI0020C740CC
MSGLACWIVEALIGSALLMALVLLVRGPVRRAFGPQIAYALWSLPLLRLILPPLPSAWRTAATPIGRAGETITILVTAPTNVPRAAMPPDLFASPAGLLSLVWAIGVVAFLACHLLAHARFCRRILAAAVSVGVEDGIHVVTSAAAPGPLAFGVWRRYVAFPADVAARYDAGERALALAHELGHHRRGDLLANWAGLAVLALHWFNPVAWIAFRAFRADQELANDARVLAGRSPAERHAYARAIVKATQGGTSRLGSTCHLHTITDLKGRLKMLSLSPASRRRLASGAAAVGALAVAGLGLTASG